MAGLWFEQLEVGQVFRHDMRRTVTETDNLLFTTLTHNPAALHLDAEYMAKSDFGKIIVNSTFTLGLMVGISVGDTTLGTAVANLLPAVLEAHHAGVPLLLLTADRPPELRGVGANQTTRQPGLFSSATRYAADLAVPEESRCNTS